ncbi:unnamed protein product, partial [marine sediment metagenome]
MSKKKVIAIGAHYDDIELGCAGTLKKHVDKGDDVRFVVLSSDEFRTGNANVRYMEQQRSLKLIGLPDQSLILFKSKDGYSTIINYLDKLSSNIIYTQYDKDTHQDHRRASEIGQAVGRKKEITTLFYSSGTSYEFYPNIFSIIDFDFKMKVLDCFNSQIIAGAVRIDTTKKYNLYLASLVKEGDHYAE